MAAESLGTRPKESPPSDQKCLEFGPLQFFSEPHLSLRSGCFGGNQWKAAACCWRVQPEWNSKATHSLD